ncbi:hypothetical protein F5884DRAFT_833538 [Xylogone sp. PMI_703]|nr:hypothetical protein F5884DRAFT_833538 [Xylogone sp. PMI_703]
MLLYEVEYGCPLTKVQRQVLANKITKLHCELYLVPSFFVAVKFSKGSTDENYSGGKEVKVNRIYAIVRSGGSRTTDDFDKLCLRLVDVWNEVLFGGEVPNDPMTNDVSMLNGVFVFRSIEASYEGGGLLPHPGEDEQWMKSNLASWKALAEAGNQDFQSIVKDVECTLRNAQ